MIICMCMYLPFKQPLPNLQTTEGCWNLQSGFVQEYPRLQGTAFPCNRANGFIKAGGILGEDEVEG